MGHTAGSPIPCNRFINLKKYILRIIKIKITSTSHRREILSYLRCTTCPRIGTKKKSTDNRVPSIVKLVPIIQRASLLPKLKSLIPTVLRKSIPLIGSQLSMLCPHNLLLSPYLQSVLRTRCSVLLHMNPRNRGISHV